MIIKFLQSPDGEQGPVRSPPPSISDSVNSAAGGAYVEASLPSESSRVVAALLTEQDYKLARLMIPEMGAFKDYEDWLDFRAGTFFGLEIAGLTVELVAVDLEMFTTWREGATAQLSISALDEFARAHESWIDRK
ncbi:MAG TPA: hypothetical protein VGF57_06990 [Roseiarcus sp.]|jgi:hypothetical protein